MTERIDKHVLANGMVILGEQMEAVGSVAFGFLLPGGASVVPQGCCGASSVISDWIFRGAASYNSRQLGDALDGLGLHRACSVGSSHIGIGAVLEAGNLHEALDLYADVVLRATLKNDEFELAKQLAIDEVRALDDDPRQKVMLKLREQFYPPPLGRSAVGKIEELEALTDDTARQIIEKRFNLSQTIFAVAGKYDFDKLCKQMENLFAEEQNKLDEALKLGQRPRRYTHIKNDGAQVHIGLMAGTVGLDDKDYYNVRVALSVLSGGMSARLFTEVREKRGLCYAVGARYHGLKAAAGVMCYAGTTPEKAQETLDVIMHEFARLKDGISEGEIERAKVGIKSALIMQNESSSSRCGGIGSDHYFLGRVRSLDEVKEGIEATSVESVLGFLRKNEFKDFTVVTIGPREVVVG